MIWIILAILCLLLVVGCFVYFFHKKFGTTRLRDWIDGIILFFAL